MSAAEAGRRRVAASVRFFRSELWLIFGRRRNWVGLAVLCTIPVIVNIAAKLSDPGGDNGDFVSSITSNGLFAALAALTLELPVFLPIAVASIAGDAIAGEANLGTLRYLVAIPAGRTRLVITKYAALVVFAATATLLVAVVGAGIGLIMFGGGRMTTLSGTSLSFGAGLGRVLLVCAYMTACLAALAAIGLFVSTLTEQPIAATIAILILTLGSAIANALPQLHAIGPYLPTHYWFAFGDLLRDPIATGDVSSGLWSALAYASIFVTAAWARFSGRDITS